MFYGFIPFVDPGPCSGKGHTTNLYVKRTGVSVDEPVTEPFTPPILNPKL